MIVGIGLAIANVTSFKRKRGQFVEVTREEHDHIPECGQRYTAFHSLIPHGLDHNLRQRPYPGLSCRLWLDFAGDQVIEFALDAELYHEHEIEIVRGSGNAPIVAGHRAGQHGIDASRFEATEHVN